MGGATHKDASRRPSSWSTISTGHAVLSGAVWWTRTSQISETRGVGAQKGCGRMCGATECHPKADTRGVHSTHPALPLEHKGLFHPRHPSTLSSDTCGQSTPQAIRSILPNTIAKIKLLSTWLPSSVKHMHTKLGATRTDNNALYRRWRRGPRSGTSPKLFSHPHFASVLPNYTLLTGPGGCVLPCWCCCGCSPKELVKSMPLATHPHKLRRLAQPKTCRLFRFPRSLPLETAIGRNH